MSFLSEIDEKIDLFIQKEWMRSANSINLIASENYPHPGIYQAVGSLLLTKYAEGYPGRRYYAGCAVVDEVEQCAISRVKALFGAEHANVQSHAGSPANMAVYLALAKPGDTILGMQLAAGGHLTHGHGVNFSGIFYKTVQYGVAPGSELLDYEQLERLAHDSKPRIIVVGASAYPRIIDYERCAAIARAVGAFFMVDMAHVAGLIAAGIYPSPVACADVVTSTTQKTLRGPRGGFILCKKELASKIDRAVMPGVQGGPFMHEIAAKAVCFHLAQQPDFIDYQRQVVANAQVLAHEFKKRGYRIVTDGTDVHFCIVDLTAKNVTGFDAEKALESVGIVVSRSCIPFDQKPPAVTSGIRLGTPAMTTRGMREGDMIRLAVLIDEVIVNHADHDRLDSIRGEVAKWVKNFPLP